MTQSLVFMTPPPATLIVVIPRHSVLEASFGGNIVFAGNGPLYFGAMSIRKAGGDWESMLLGIEPRQCKVCSQGLYRDKTLFRGGWSRCTICNEFVHYSCLASGKVKFLKRRPRVCKVCSTARAATPAAAGSSPVPPANLAVGS